MISLHTRCQRTCAAPRRCCVWTERIFSCSPALSSLSPSWASSSPSDQMQKYALDAGGRACAFSSQVYSRCSVCSWRQVCARRKADGDAVRALVIRSCRRRRGRVSSFFVGPTASTPQPIYTRCVLTGGPCRAASAGAGVYEMCAACSVQRAVCSRRMGGEDVRHFAAGSRQGRGTSLISASTPRSRLPPARFRLPPVPEL